MNLLSHAIECLPYDDVPTGHIESGHLVEIEEKLGHSEPNFPIVLMTEVSTTGALDRKRLEPEHRFFIVCGSLKLQKARESGAPSVRAVLMAGDADSAARAAAVLRNSPQALEFARKQWPGWDCAEAFASR